MKSQFLIQIIAMIKIKIGRIFIIPCLIIFFTVFSCQSTETLVSGFGTAVFYTTSNSRGRIEITIAYKNNPVSFVLPVTNDPESYCKNGWTGYVLLDIGTYTYKAVATDGTQWNGTVEITKGFCTQRKIQ